MKIFSQHSWLSALLVNGCIRIIILTALLVSIFVLAKVYAQDYLPDDNDTNLWNTHQPNLGTPFPQQPTMVWNPSTGQYIDDSQMRKNARPAQPQPLYRTPNPPTPNTQADPNPISPQSPQPLNPSATFNAQPMGRLNQRQAALQPNGSSYYLTNVGYGAGAGLLAGLALASLSGGNSATKISIVGTSAVLGGVIGFLVALNQASKPPVAANSDSWDKDMGSDNNILSGQGYKAVLPQPLALHFTMWRQEF